MAQSAFAAGGGNAKMAQLKKLQANRNLSPAALRRLVEQIGRRNLNANKPQRPRQGQGSRRPTRGTGATSSSKIDSSKYDMDSQPPKGPNQVKPAKPAATAPKPKPKPKPTAAKPKPKPARSSTYSHADMMKDIRASDREAARSKELEKLKKLREEAKQKSLKIGRQKRSRRNTTARGPRDR